MAHKFIEETELPGKIVDKDQLAVINHRYYIASMYVLEKDVLEVGCGPGLGLSMLSNHAKMIAGGDITKESLRLAKKKCMGRNNIAVISMDAHDMPFKSESFDVIICVATIIYLELPKFLSECYRVLRKGGLLILNTPNKDVPGFLKSRLGSNYYSIPALCTLLNNCDFDAEFQGAFPIFSDETSQHIIVVQRHLKRMVLKALDTMPQGQRLKAIISDYIKRDKVNLREEIIEDELAMIKNIPFCKLPPNLPDHRYRVIYILCHKSI